MGFHDIHEDDINEYLHILLDLKTLNGAAEGITKLVIDKGVEALSEKQRFVFEKEVIEPYTYEECARCGCNIPWCEMFGAYENDGLCSWCIQMKSKLDNE